MVKGPLVITDFAAKSGQGTPMFSRPGKATITEHIAFKEHGEPRDKEQEKLAVVPENVQNEQLKVDLKGEITDALQIYLKEELAKQAAKVLEDQVENEALLKASKKVDKPP